MPSIQQLAAKLNRKAVEGLKKNATAMPADKVAWQPLDVGRTVVSQLAECAVITGFNARLLIDRAVPPMDMEAFQKAVSDLDTTEKAISALDASADALAGAIESFPSADLDQTIKLPWFEEAQSFAEIMLLGYWNNVYHVGQICYMQTLYGDKEMH